MLRIANDCVAQGHNVTIFTGQWRGEKSNSVKVELLEYKGFLNHQRHQSLINSMKKVVESKSFDLVVGFNRIPDLDVYYAADPCFIERVKTDRGWWYKLLARYRFFVACERAVMSVESKCKILSLTPREKAIFQAWYGTPNERFYDIPPNIPLSKFSGIDLLVVRKRIRAEFNLSHDTRILLMVGSAFYRKGVDRAIEAFAALPVLSITNTYLLVVGEDEPDAMLKLAAKLGVANQLLMLGARNDVPELMMAADIFLHPARSELAGLVIIEAMTASLPVIVSANCGYAPHVKAANCGIVIEEPFLQSAFNCALHQLLHQQDLSELKSSGNEYVMKMANSQSHSYEADLLVKFAQEKNKLKVVTNHVSI